jgi:hypothetical protein
MENDFLSWYKTKFHQLDKISPNDAWEHISNDLDLDDVWQEINAKLNKRDKRKTIAKITVYLILMISLGVGLFMFNNKQTISDKAKLISKHSTTANSNNKKENITTESIENNSPHNKNLEQRKENLFSKSEMVKTSSLTEKEKNQLTIIKNDFLTAKGDAYSVYTSIEKHNGATTNCIDRNKRMFAINPIMASIKADDKQLLDFLIHQPLNDSIHKKSVNNNKYTAVNIHSFIVGASFSNANTWLLNNDTYTGLRAGTLNQALFSFGKSYNLFLGYNISTNYCLQTEWFINNAQNQQYIDYTNGHHVSRNLEANYTQLNILMKKKNEVFYSGGKLHVSFNYLAGLNYSYVKSFTQKTDEMISSVKNEYQNNQYGLILGLEYQIYITPSWIICTGARTNIGLQNIYKGNDKTYNSSIGINIGVGYQIIRKKSPSQIFTK